jgi:hypothetical protein
MTAPTNVAPAGRRPGAANPGRNRESNIMSKQSALRLIKSLRDAVNDTAIETDLAWINQVCFHLDAAADVLEFPKDGTAPVA